MWSKESLAFKGCDSSNSYRKESKEWDDVKFQYVNMYSTYDVEDLQVDPLRKKVRVTWGTKYSMFLWSFSSVKR